MDVNRLLNQYFAKHVQLRKLDIDRVYPKVTEFIELLLQECHRLDDEICVTAIHVGSYWQGLKVDKPDEYDVCVQFNPEKVVLGNWNDGPTCGLLDKKNNQILSEDRALEEKIDNYELIDTRSRRLFKQEDGITVPGRTGVNFFIPFLMRKRLKTIMCRALNFLYQKELVSRCTIEEHGPAITLKTSIDKGIKISIDFTACFRFEPKDVPQLQIDWPYSSWPHSSEEVSKVLSCHINYVAKKNFTFDTSYNELEKQLSKFADSDGGNRKKCHRLMKSINQQFWSQDDDKPLIDSYRLKTVWLLQCDMYPNTSDWVVEKIYDRMVCLLNFLCNCLNKGHLPMYFNKEINLLGESNKEELRKKAAIIKDFVDNMGDYLDDYLSQDSNNNL